LIAIDSYFAAFDAALQSRRGWCKQCELKSVWHPTALRWSANQWEFGYGNNQYSNDETSDWSGWGRD
jgi:hypothetical protein